jgi:prepilin-type N-terminal cleavage/methylation domain-containing protein
MKRKRAQSAGFTLVEMMVAVSIFSTASVIVADLFLIANRAQRRTSTEQQIQSDARIIISQVSDRIRSGEIDYDGYGGTAPSVGDVLRVIDERGNLIVVRQSDSVFSNTVCPTAQSTPCLEISDDNGITFAPMTSDGVKVAGVQFFIDPPQSPTLPGGGGFLYSIQPRVTMVVGLQGTSPQAAQGTTFVQTTVSSRTLLR